MATAPVLLRRAQPTIAEGLRFARYLDDAADGIFRTMLGRNSEQVIAKAYRTPGHDLSFEHVTFAEHGGAVVGTTSAYSSQQHEQSSESPLIRAAGLRAVRMAAVSTAAASLFRFIDAMADGDFYLQAIAVDPDRQGLGIGSKLFGQVEDEARRVGCERLTLVVAVKNEGARRLYERMGMTIEATSPKSALLPDGQVHRMAKPL